jgi:hypothetical protein
MLRDVQGLLVRDGEIETPYGLSLTAAADEIRARVTCSLVEQNVRQTLMVADRAAARDQRDHAERRRRRPAGRRGDPTACLGGDVAG